METAKKFVVVGVINLALFFVIVALLVNKQSQRQNGTQTTFKWLLIIDDWLMTIYYYYLYWSPTATFRDKDSLLRFAYKKTLSVSRETYLAWDSELAQD